MFRLLSQQAIKPLRNRPLDPLQNTLCKPLRNPLREPLEKRQIHTTIAPFSGPPTYETIARRFSSYPNPLIYFRHIEANEAKQRGEFIDIHDVGGVDPKDFDVLISDVNENTLQTEISKLTGIEYLQKATKEEAYKPLEIGHAFTYGRKSRTIFPCIVSFRDTAHWVFFIVDSGAPLTYISNHTAEALGIKNDTDARIAGYTHPVSISPEQSHFAELNLLGADFLGKKISILEYDDNAKKVKMYFNSHWKVTKAQ